MAATSDRATVSVVIPAFRAERTIVRATASLLAQTRGDFEAIVVSDDGVDYAALLASAGIADPRIRHLTSGGVGTGCARARNVGFAAVTGHFVTRLDADDLFLPDRLERLVPAAAASGAAVDMVSVVDEESGLAVRRTRFAGPTASAAELALLHCPLAPLVARALAPPWFADVDIAEDVLHLFAVEERAGAIAVVDTALYDYRVRLDSMCHGDDGAERAEWSYAEIDRRLALADFDGLGAATCARARPVFAEKRAFNRRFAVASTEGRARDFQSFCATEEARGTALRAVSRT